jgi:hypothetical protein
MTDRRIVIPGTEVEALFRDETIFLMDSDGCVFLTAAQLAYVLQEYGPFSVPVEPGAMERWRGIEGASG